jgi:hypothetical protein
MNTNLVQQIIKKRTPLNAGFLSLLALSLGLGSPVEAKDDAAKAPLKPRAVKASSTAPNSNPARAIDGIISDDSRWISKASRDPAWLELDLGSVQKLAGIQVYSGYGVGNPIRSFVVQFRRDGQWHNIPAATFTNNRANALTIPFGTVDVTTDALRLWITSTPEYIARVLEVVVWPASVGEIPPLETPIVLTDLLTVRKEPVPAIYLNQSGFNVGKPKRFTAPTAPDGTKFEVRTAQGGTTVFSGTLTNHIGDFTAFNPTDNREYVVVAGGNVSVPFRIGPWWLERVNYQGAVDFMVDSRHYVGNERSPCPDSFSWRDDCQFGWTLNSLVPQYLSNPSAYERMPHQITYEKPTNPKLWGKLQPYREDAPDIVKMIHWGADVIVTQGLTHEHLKCQLAYFLYAWPVLKEYLPEQNYEVVRDFTFTNWTQATCDRKYPYDESTSHNLLEIKTKIGTTKGATPPGYSVEPNLLLYEVAKRDKRPDAEQYFQAAYRQAEWMIANLDWNDPLVTKGQRMSEFITMTGLAHLMAEYPDRAPAGLAAKINAWVEVMIRRSNNLWDFRKLDDKDGWTPMGKNPQKWNEPGNVVGLPAALLAAEPFVTNSAAKARIEQIVWSHFDNLFGRNPTGRHFSYRAPEEVEGVEHGWFTRVRGGFGLLANARFAIDGSPKDGHYPYHPQKGNIGYTEGWVTFNTPFNTSLAYLARAETKLTLRRDGDALVVRLEAPLNFDYDKVESGKVLLTSSNGDRETVVVTEESPSSRFLTGRITIKSGAPPKADDGVLQTSPGASVEASHGFGYWGRRASLSIH